MLGVARRTGASWAASPDAIELASELGEVEVGASAPARLGA